MGQDLSSKFRNRDSGVRSFSSASAGGALVDARPLAAGAAKAAHSELGRILGPLVNPLLRDSSGALDLSKIPAKNFEEFKIFLIEQVKIDGIAFNQVLLDSYHKVLSEKKFEPLLKAFWESDIEHRTSDIADSRFLLKQFTAEIAAVHFDKFVGHHFATPQGRELLLSLLEARDGDFLADLVKAIGAVGKQNGVAGKLKEDLDRHLSSWNVFNLFTSREDLLQGIAIAKMIISQADTFDRQAQQSQDRYLQAPKEVGVLRSSSLGKEISPEQIQAMANWAKEKQSKTDPLSQLQAKLAGLWLTAVDDGLWRDRTMEVNRVYLIKNLESLLEKSKRAAGEASFKTLCDEIHDFISGELNADGNRFLNWVKDIMVGHNLNDVFAGMPSAFRSSYDELRQFSEEIHHAYDMGERIFLEVPELHAEDPKVREAASHFIQKLSGATRSLWYGYKQHKLLSRIGSNVADVVGAGDKEDIRAANKMMGEMIARLQKVRTQEEIEAEAQKLYQELNPNGVLYRAFAAAEMDGMEQFLGILQTVGIIAATSLATGGSGTAVAIGRFGILAAKARYGLGMGAYISFAENSIAVASGEVRQGNDNLFAWAKDSIATGLAMGFFTPAAMSLGEGVSQNIFHGLWNRYFTGWIRNLGRGAVDTLLEGGEELFDASVRKMLDWDFDALSIDQMAETLRVSMAGGGLKVGAVAEAFRTSRSDNGQLTTDNGPSKPGTGGLPPATGHLPPDSGPKTQDSGLEGNETPSSPEVPQTIGQTLKKARELFQEYGLSETQVSLRETTRVREYLRTYGPSMGMARATVMGLWLTLGAHLTPEHRQGELGQKLKELILKAEIPGISPGLSTEELKASLDPQPIQIDPNLGPEGTLLKEAVKGTSFEKFGSLLPYLLLPLEPAFASTARKLITPLLRHPYLSIYGPEHAEIAKILMQIAPHLDQEKRKEALERAREILRDAPLVEGTYGQNVNYRLMTEVALEWARLSAHLEGEEKQAAISKALRLSKRILTKQKTHPASHVCVNALLTLAQIGKLIKDDNKTQAKIKDILIRELHLRGFRQRADFSREAALSLVELSPQIYLGEEERLKIYQILRKAIPGSRKSKTPPLHEAFALGKLSAQLPGSLKRKAMVFAWKVLKDAVPEPRFFEESKWMVSDLAEYSVQLIPYLVGEQREEAIRMMLENLPKWMAASSKLPSKHRHAIALIRLSTHLKASEQEYWQKEGLKAFKELILEIDYPLALWETAAINDLVQEFSQFREIFKSEFQEVLSRYQKVTEQNADTSVRVEESELKELLDPQPIKIDPQLGLQGTLIKEAIKGTEFANFQNPLIVSHWLLPVVPELAINLKNLIQEDVRPDVPMDHPSVARLLMQIARYVDEEQRKEILQTVRRVFQIAPTVTGTYLDQKDYRLIALIAIEKMRLSTLLEGEEREKEFNRALISVENIPKQTQNGSRIYEAFKALSEMTNLVKGDVQTLGKIKNILWNLFNNKQSDASSVLSSQRAAFFLAKLSPHLPLDQNERLEIFRALRDRITAAREKGQGPFFEQTLALAKLSAQLEGEFGEEDISPLWENEINAARDPINFQRTDNFSQLVEAIPYLQGGRREEAIQIAREGLTKALATVSGGFKGYYGISLIQLSFQMEGEEQKRLQDEGLEALLKVIESDNDLSHLAVSLQDLAQEHHAIRQLLDSRLQPVLSRYRKLAEGAADAAVRVDESELEELMDPQALQLDPNLDLETALFQFAAQSHPFFQKMSRSERLHYQMAHLDKYSPNQIETLVAEAIQDRKENDPDDLRFQNSIFGYDQGRRFALSDEQFEALLRGVGRRVELTGDERIEIFGLIGRNTHLTHKQAALLLEHIDEEKFADRKDINNAYEIISRNPNLSSVQVNNLLWKALTGLRNKPHSLRSYMGMIANLARHPNLSIPREELVEWFLRFDEERPNGSNALFLAYLALNPNLSSEEFADHLRVISPILKKYPFEKAAVQATLDQSQYVVAQDLDKIIETEINRPAIFYEKTQNLAELGKNPRLNTEQAQRIIEFLFLDDPKNPGNIWALGTFGRHACLTREQFKQIIQAAQNKPHMLDAGTLINIAQNPRLPKDLHDSVFEILTKTDLDGTINVLGFNSSNSQGQREQLFEEFQEIQKKAEKLKEKSTDRAVRVEEAELAELMDPKPLRLDPTLDLETALFQHVAGSDPFFKGMSKEERHKYQLAHLDKFSPEEIEAMVAEAVNAIKQSQRQIFHWFLWGLMAGFALTDSQLKAMIRGVQKVDLEAPLRVRIYDLIGNNPKLTGPQVTLLLKLMGEADPSDANAYDNNISSNPNLSSEQVGSLIKRCCANDKLPYISKTLDNLAVHPKLSKGDRESLVRLILSIEEKKPGTVSPFLLAHIAINKNLSQKEFFALFKVVKRFFKKADISAHAHAILSQSPFVTPRALDRLIRNILETSDSLYNKTLNLGLLGRNPNLTPEQFQRIFKIFQEHQFIGVENKALGFSNLGQNPRLTRAELTQLIQAIHGLRVGPLIAAEALSPIARNPSLPQDLYDSLFEAIFKLHRDRAIVGLSFHNENSQGRRDQLFERFLELQEKAEKLKKKSTDRAARVDEAELEELMDPKPLQLKPGEKPVEAMLRAAAEGSFAGRLDGVDVARLLGAYDAELEEGWLEWINQVDGSDIDYLAQRLQERLLAPAPVHYLLSLNLALLSRQFARSDEEASKILLVFDEILSIFNDQDIVARILGDFVDLVPNKAIFSAQFHERLKWCVDNHVGAGAAAAVALVKIGEGIKGNRPLQDKIYNLLKSKLNAYVIPDFHNTDYAIGLGELAFFQEEEQRQETLDLAAETLQRDKGRTPLSKIPGAIGLARISRHFSGTEKNKYLGKAIEVLKDSLKHEEEGFRTFAAKELGVWVRYSPEAREAFREDIEKIRKKYLAMQEATGDSAVRVAEAELRDLLDPPSVQMKPGESPAEAIIRTAAQGSFVEDLRPRDIVNLTRHYDPELYEDLSERLDPGVDFDQLLKEPRSGYSELLHRLNLKKLAEQLKTKNTEGERERVFKFFRGIIFHDPAPSVRESAVIVLSNLAEYLSDQPILYDEIFAILHEVLEGHSTIAVRAAIQLIKMPEKIKKHPQLAPRILEALVLAMDNSSDFFIPGPIALARLSPHLEGQQKQVALDLALKASNRNIVRTLDDYYPIWGQVGLAILSEYSEEVQKGESLNKALEILKTHLRLPLTARVAAEAMNALIQYLPSGREVLRSEIEGIINRYRRLEAATGDSAARVDEAELRGLLDPQPVQIRPGENPAETLIRAASPKDGFLKNLEPVDIARLIREYDLEFKEKWSEWIDKTDGKVDFEELLYCLANNRDYSTVNRQLLNLNLEKLAQKLKSANTEEEVDGVLGVFGGLILREKRGNTAHAPQAIQTLGILAELLPDHPMVLDKIHEILEPALRYPQNHFSQYAARALVHIPHKIKENSSLAKKIFSILKEDIEQNIYSESALALVELAVFLEGEEQARAIGLAVQTLRALSKRGRGVTSYFNALLGLARISYLFEGSENKKYLPEVMEIWKENLNDSNLSIQSVAAKRLVNLTRRVPEAREALRPEMYRILRRLRSLKAVSPDEAARVEPKKDSKPKLSTFLQILGAKLKRSNSKIKARPKVVIDPDFDPTLVTAHKLTNQVVQALTINRFVLISGDPASGKSEVGRYIASQLGWEHHVFNAHRYLSQEEVMQKIGVVANGKTRFVISDGPLADALIHGKLFILNEIHRAKPGNLSFLFNLLADIDTEFDYYDATTGKTIRKKIHPNFRMIGTRNLDGAAMNEALRNRAIEIYADRYSDLELAALLRSKYPALVGGVMGEKRGNGETEKRGEGDLADTLVRFFEDMRHRMEARAIGEHGEGYAWNLRHLMRVAEGFSNGGHRTSDIGHRSLDAGRILQIMWDRVGVSLTPKDRGNFFDAVRNFQYDGVTVTEKDVREFQEKQKNLTIRDVVGAIHELPLQDMGIKDIPTSARYLDSILKSLQAGYHPWLKGPAGTGKSKLARFAASLLGKVYMDTLSPQTDESKLKGDFKPKIDITHGKDHLAFTHVPSPLINALRDQSSDGLVTAILDEAAFARPDVIEEFNTLLDRDGGIWVMSEDGEQFEFLKRGENFRLILVSNTYGYEGVNLQSEAFRSRTHEIYMDFEYTAEEIAELVGPVGAIHELPLQIGKILHDARQLFISHGEPESSVTLREVSRIQIYLNIFLTKDANSNETAKAILRALWLTLGASLPKEKREGELGQKLRELISQIEIPGVDKVEIQQDLYLILQPKPIEFQLGKNALMTIINAAFRESWIKDFPTFFKAIIIAHFDIKIGLRLLLGLSANEDSKIDVLLGHGLVTLSQDLEGEEEKKVLNLALKHLQRFAESKTGYVHRKVAKFLGNLDQKIETEELREALNRALPILRGLVDPMGHFLSKAPNSPETYIQHLVKGQEGLDLRLPALRELTENEMPETRRLAVELLVTLSQNWKGKEKEEALGLALMTLGELAGNEELEFRPTVSHFKLVSQLHDFKVWLKTKLKANLEHLQKLYYASIDEAVRILPDKGDNSELPQNLNVLAGELQKNNPEINADLQVEIDPNFDPTLVTAHKLTNQVIQALTINRFVLISGDPASGKSEVGRYIAGQLGWEHHVFNAHRYLSQEEVMQKIGVVANGKTRFVISDGPLADALIHGKLFILNEIHRAKPGNLSFLFNLLADIDTEFDYYDATTGKTVRKKIHPNFRMIGTRNLDGGVMNEALKNRAIEIYADRYSDLELGALLRSKYPNLGEGGPHPVPLPGGEGTRSGSEGELADTLVRFFEDMRHRMEARAIGEHGEGYAWNLRHLMRVAEGFEAEYRTSDIGHRPLDAGRILQIMWDRVGVSLTPKDRGNFFDAVRGFEYDGVKINEQDVEKFKEKQKKLTIGEVVGARRAVTLQEMGIKDIPTSARYLDSILKSLRAGYHPWLKGPAGTGKSKLARFAASLLGKVYMDTLSPQTDESKLKGDFKPKIDITYGKDHLAFTHVPSPLINALRDNASEGLVTAILDEAAFARPDVIEEFHTLLDRDGGIWVMSEDGKHFEFLRRPKNFRLILASNNYGYEGVQLQSEAFRSRTHEIYMDFEYTPEEIAELLGDSNGTHHSSPITHNGLEQTLGQILHDARQLFISQGEPESSVTLREVNRIQNYLNIFLSENADDSETVEVILRALWLTLGASLPKEKREGDLGKKLQELISKTDIPGVVKTAIQKELQQIIQPKPVIFDASKTSTGAMLQAALRGTFAQRLSTLEVAKLLGPVKPQLSLELLIELIGVQQNVAIRGEIAGAFGDLGEHLKGDIEALEKAIATLRLLSKDESGFIHNVAEKFLEILTRQLEGGEKVPENLEVSLEEEIERLLKHNINTLIVYARDEENDIGVDEVEILDHLKNSLEGEEKKKKQAANQALEVLLDLCENKNSAIRGTAANALVKLVVLLKEDKVALNKILSMLLKLCWDEIDSIYLEIPEELVFLSRYLKDDKKTLNKILKTLLEICDHEDDIFSFHAAQALGKLSEHLEGEDKKQALAKALFTLLELSKDDVKESVVSVALEMGVLSTYLEHELKNRTLNTALEILFHFCSDEDNEIRMSAHQDILDLGEKIPEVWERLKTELMPAVRRYEELKVATRDSATRISKLKGDHSDLSQNLSIFAKELYSNNPEINADPQVEINPNFDPTIVTAHKLTDQVVQALAINRFVLISGDPASGKSEVGRYIAGQLAWDHHVFNAHRYLSQEEVMQKIGVVANGKTRFVISDGPLADVLINGKLFILNEVHRAKPGNLSFLFNLLADIDTEFDYYDAKTGKTIRMKIHPNFRMIGTRNLDGAAMNEALKNRAIEIYADRYSDLELGALLRSKYPGLDSLADTLVRFFEDMRHRMEARAIGEHGEGYAWNLRHLMRLAEGFEAEHRTSDVGHRPLDAGRILQLMWDRVGVSLTPKDRGNFFDAVRNFEYDGVKISDQDVEIFQQKQKELNFHEVSSATGMDEGRLRELARRIGVKDIPTSARYLDSILKSLRAGYHPWLKGPAGTGKSKLARFAACLLGKVYMDTLSPQTDESKLKGDFKPKIDITHGKDHLAFTHVPSPLINALRDHASEGLVTAILDEAAFARPDVIEELNTLLDRDGGIWVMSEDGEHFEFLKRPKNFRLILASNNYGYEGVNLQSEAFRSRTHEIYMDFEYEAEELDVLMGIRPVARGFSPALGPQAQGVGPASQAQVGPKGPPYKSPAISMARSFGGAQAYTQRIHRVQAPALDMMTSPVREKLAEARDRIPEEIILELEKKYQEVEKRLLGAAASMGRTGEIIMDFDPHTQSFAMTLEAPRIFKVGPSFLLEHDAERLVNIAMHEGGHADIDRIGSGFFFQDEIHQALLNVGADVRVNARVMDRAPGRKDSYYQFLRDYYFESYKKIPDQEIPELFPHEAYLQAIMSKEYGGESPWDQDPLVGPALRNTWGAIQKIKESRPKEANPDEVIVQRYVTQVEGILKKDVLPTYLGLYQEALKQAEDHIKNLGEESTEPGQPGGRGPLIDPKHLSEAARKKLAERAKRIADAHAPKGDLGDKQQRAGNYYGEGDQAPAGKPKTPSTAKPGSLEEALQNRHEDYHRQQEGLKRKPFSKLLSDLKDLPQKLFAVFDRLLKPNTDFEYEGFYPSGPRPDIQRVVKAIHGMLATLNVFKRKTEATAKDYRFSLLLDASGSMADGGSRERGGLGLAAMFVDVFERLDLPYGLDAFHNSYFPLKGFATRLKTLPERNNFFNMIQFNYWGYGGTNIRSGIRGSLQRLLEARKSDPRDQEFLFVLTDGQETHQEGATIRQLCEEAFRKGIIVVGIGIGEGMETVRKEFPIYLVEKNPENLPHLMAEFIKQYVTFQNGD